MWARFILVSILLFSVPSAFGAKAEVNRPMVRVGTLSGGTASNHHLAIKSWEKTCKSWLEQKKSEYSSFELLLVMCGKPDCLLDVTKNSCASQTRIHYRNKTAQLTLPKMKQSFARGEQ